MNDLYRQAVSLSFFAKGAAATVGVLIIHAAFRVLEKTLPQRFGRADLFDQIWLAALMADGRWPEARQVLEQRRASDPDGAPLNQMLARTYEALDLPVQAAEARARAAATLARHAA